MTAAAKQRTEDAAIAAQQRLESATEATIQRDQMMKLLEASQKISRANVARTNGIAVSHK